MQNTLDIIEAQTLTRETLLESLSLDLMTDSILQQIHCEVSSTTDFLAIVKDKFDAILEEEEIEDEDKKELKDQIIDFCHDLLDTISREYSFYVNPISDDYDSNFDLLYTTYQFLVLNKYANVERFLIEYIERNKTELLNSIDGDNRGKDITSLSARKRNVGKDNTNVLSGLNEIIDFIYTGNLVEPEEFLNVIDDGELYTHHMIELYQEQTIMGNFVPALLYKVLGEAYDGNELTRIRNTIRVHFYQSDEE